MKDRTKIIERIRKCQSQALRAGTRQEAETAAGMAHDLREKHGITDEELHPRPVEAPVKGIPFRHPPTFIRVIDEIAASADPYDPLVAAYRAFRQAMEPEPVRKGKVKVRRRA